MMSPHFPNFVSHRLTMNTFWTQVPFLRLLPAVLCGILTAVYADFIPLQAALLFSLVLIFSLSIFIFFRRYFAIYRLRWISGMHFYFILFFFFYVLTLEDTAMLDPQHFQSELKEAKAFAGYLSEEPIEKGKSRKTVLEVIQIKTPEGWRSCRGRVLAYISRDSLSENLSYGDMISFTSLPVPTESPKNPYQFNYKNYLHFHQTEHQVYLVSGKWKQLNANVGNPVLRFAVSARKKLLSIYKANHINGQEYAVLSALTLGYVDEIDDETKRAFSASGAMHVLSVSGQHVGIIFAGLMWILFFLNGRGWKKMLQSVLLLMLIWSYVIITGLSPAVLRAGAMISFIIIGKLLQRNTNIFNTIAASAIFLLAFNPFLIMEVGFQLSYLAVSGIVLMQPWVYRQFYVRNWLGDKIWMITSISIAAQLATFPLGLLYYQQFPNYFIFSNLIVIPLSAVIIYGGIALLIFSPIPTLTSILAAAVNRLTWLLNMIVYNIEQLPYSITTGIAFSIFQTWLLYFAIASLGFFIVRRSSTWLLISLVVTICLLTMMLNDYMNISKQKQFVVYHIKGATAVQLTEGRNSILIADSALLQNESRFIFNISRNINHLGVASLTKVETEKSSEIKTTISDGIVLKNNFVLFGSKKYFIANDSLAASGETERKIQLDAVIVTKKSVRNISSLLSNFSFHRLIVSSSVPGWLAKKLQAQCAEKNIACYLVEEKGAFIEEN
jgi:competence protein ComEC